MLQLFWHQRSQRSLVWYVAAAFGFGVSGVALTWARQHGILGWRAVLMLRIRRKQRQVGHCLESLLLLPSKGGEGHTISETIGSRDGCAMLGHRPCAQDQQYIRNVDDVDHDKEDNGTRSDLSIRDRADTVSKALQAGISSEKAKLLAAGKKGPKVYWARVRKYWVVGHYEDPFADVFLSLGMRLDKNPKGTPCMQMMLTENEKTVGYLLFEMRDEAVALRGMHVSEVIRGKGLSTILTVTWLKLCFMLEARPETIKIDKPLVSLALQKFGFTAINQTTSVDVSTDADSTADGRIHLWSEDMTRLRSAFSHNYLKTQGMVICQRRPITSKTVYVNTVYSAPKDDEALRKSVTSALSGKALDFYCDAVQLRDLVQQQLRYLPGMLERRKRGATTHVASLPSTPAHPAVAEGA
eukprot:TRINITY_DN41066_c0_g1_i1.p1 TRINITY_DN41066_c0_g1~~TRINITY_DN41066_c0_g1_i1.p1  ORF type:complete len:411 (+),score=53.78 TRINITY_DN41066_c0_g1_i1:242-1474(+)